jgi:hypothetical protein
MSEIALKPVVCLEKNIRVLSFILDTIKLRFFWVNAADF